MRKQILTVDLHEFVRVQPEVNFAADRINLDDNLKTSWNKILSSVSILCLSYLDNTKRVVFYDAQFVETFIGRFNTIIPDGIRYFPCIELYREKRHVHSSCFQTLLEAKVERILFT